MNRREFILGAGAFGAAAPAIALDAKKSVPPAEDAILRLGVVSDIHVTDDASCADLRTALKMFDRRRADGVLATGDLADHGLFSQLKRVAATWNEVFPDFRRSDGGRIERLFHYGDHDTALNAKARKRFVSDPGLDGDFIPNIGLAKAWEDAFGEKYEPVKVVNVKGYDFVLVHFDPRGGSTGCTKAAQEFLASYKPANGKPFFYSQHRIPFGLTKYRAKKGGLCDMGDAAKALSKSKNAIALCGHGHRSFLDERSFYNEGGRVCVEIPAVKFPLAGEPGKSHEDKEHPYQCIVMNVFDGFVEFERIDFKSGEALAEPWKA